MKSRDQRLIHEAYLQVLGAADGVKGRLADMSAQDVFQRVKETGVGSPTQTAWALAELFKRYDNPAEFQYDSFDGQWFMDKYYRSPVEQRAKFKLLVGLLAQDPQRAATLLKQGADEAHKAHNKAIEDQHAAARAQQPPADTRPLSGEEQYNRDNAVSHHSYWD